MNRFIAIVGTTVLLAAVTPARAADDSSVKAATKQVEQGATQLGKGVEETAKGVGQTVVEGSKYTGEKLKESAKAAEPEAKSAWKSAKDGAYAFANSVRAFFASFFSK
jgi:hypothetical protein